MKWIIAAACLTCSDPTPMPIATIEASEEACKVLAAMTLKFAAPNFAVGTVAATWCVPMDDWQDVDAYPQRR